MILPSASPLREVNEVRENVHLKAKSAHNYVLDNANFITGLLAEVRRWAENIASMKERRGVYRFGGEI